MDMTFAFHVAVQTTQTPPHIKTGSDHTHLCAAHQQAGVRVHLQD